MLVIIILKIFWPKMFLKIFSMTWFTEVAAYIAFMAFFLKAVFEADAIL